MDNKFTPPEYDPKLSPERNAEIAEWAERNFHTMKIGKSILVDNKRFNFGEQDFDEDCVTDE